MEITPLQSWYLSQIQVAKTVVIVEALSKAYESDFEAGLIVPSLVTDPIVPPFETEPPRFYRRVVGSNIKLLFQRHSRLHRSSPLLHGG